MSRIEWLLGGILALLLIIIVGLLVMWWHAPAAPAQQVVQQPPPGAAGRDRNTAQTAFQIAEPAAREWSADAQLLAANASWPQQGWQMGAGNWTLTFYSAGKGATSLIRVSGNEAQLVNVNSASRQYQPASTDNWRIDSPDLINRLLATAAENEYGQIDAGSLLLSLHTNQGLQWEAIILELPGGGLQITVDAATGQALNVRRIIDGRSE